jgi:predicted transcriptional regulator
MSTDDTSDDDDSTIDTDGAAGVDGEAGADVRERLEQEADRAIEQFDEGIVDLLSWMLDTETRARIYVHLRQHPNSTSDEIAEGTGLYPSTVRKALAELHDEGRVSRSKRQSDGAGNNPYEYSALAPSDLVSDLTADVQRQLNTVFNMDQVLGTDDEQLDDGPVTITVTEEHDENRRENGASVDDGEDSDDASDDHGANADDGEDAGDVGDT